MMDSEATMKAIRPSECIIDDQAVAAGIALPLQSICQNNNYPLQSYIEEGLGPAQVVALRLSSGRCAALYESLTYSERHTPFTNLIVEHNPKHIEADTIEILIALKLQHEHVVILHPDLMMTCASLMRTDDNGVEYEVHRSTPLWQASLMAQQYERSGHKQHYWVRRVPSEPSNR